MTAPLPRRKEIAVIHMFFEGLSYDQIARHASVAKGSVEEVIRRLKAGEYAEFQDIHDLIDELRDTAVMVRKEFGGDVERAHTGSVAWVSLNRIGVDPAKVPAWARMCEDLATSDMPPQKFVEIALWCRQLQDGLEVDLLELPAKLETLKVEFDALAIKRDAVEVDVEDKQASLTALQEKLGLSQEIQELRATRETEDSLLAEARGRTVAALASAQVTSETLEKFRVFAGTLSARAVPLDGQTFDTLLVLVANLGPQGIREVNTLRGLLAKEKMSAAQGAALLTGLWRTRFDLRRAVDVANALGTREPFPEALSRLASALDQYGSLPAVAAATKRRMDELQRTEEAQRREAETIAVKLASLQQELADRTREVTEASEERDLIRGEIRKAASDFEAYAKAGAADVRRIEAMREAFFDEWPYRMTREDYSELGARMMKKPSQGPVDPLARWIWGLISGLEERLDRQRRGAGGPILNGPDGNPVEDTFIITLSWEERRRLGNLVHEASLEAEGPLHCLTRITAGDTGDAPKYGSQSTEQDAEPQDEFLRRRRATAELLQFLKEISDGKRGQCVPLQSGAPSSGPQ